MCGVIPRSRIAGQDEDHQITNVTLQNVTILGEPMSDLKEMKIDVNDFCDGITMLQLFALCVLLWRRSIIKRQQRLDFVQRSDCLRQLGVL